MHDAAATTVTRRWRSVPYEKLCPGNAALDRLRGVR